MTQNRPTTVNYFLSRRLRLIICPQISIFERKAGSDVEILLAAARFLELRLKDVV
jgi:hypothetical protein